MLCSGGDFGLSAEVMADPHRDLSKFLTKYIGFSRNVLILLIGTAIALFRPRRPGRRRVKLQLEPT
jgi:hypothetical protein